MPQKKYRAKVGVTYPADAESLKKARADKMEDVKWTHAEPGEVLTPYNADILKSWLENDAVEEIAEEVKSDG
jgi:DNA replication protein DnaD